MYQMKSIALVCYYYVVMHPLVSSVESFLPQVNLMRSSSNSIVRSMSAADGGSSTSSSTSSITSSVRPSPQLLEFVEPMTNVTVVLVGSMHYNPTSIRLASQTVKELGQTNRLGSVVVE